MSECSKTNYKISCLLIVGFEIEIFLIFASIKIGRIEKYNNTGLVEAKYMMDAL